MCTSPTEINTKSTIPTRSDPVTCIGTKPDTKSTIPSRSAQSPILTRTNRKRSLACASTARQNPVFWLGVGCLQEGHKWVFQHYGTWRWCQTPDSTSFSEQFLRRRTLLLHFSSQSYYERPTTTKFRCFVTPPNHAMTDLQQQNSGVVSLLPIILWQT